MVSALFLFLCVASVGLSLYLFVSCYLIKPHACLKKYSIGRNCNSIGRNCNFIGWNCNSIGWSIFFMRMKIFCHAYENLFPCVWNFFFMHMKKIDCMLMWVRYKKFIKTKHRNLFAGLIAYNLLPKKPEMNVEIIDKSRLIP